MCSRQRPASEPAGGGGVPVRGGTGPPAAGVAARSQPCEPIGRLSFPGRAPSSGRCAPTSERDASRSTRASPVSAPRGRGGGGVQGRPATCLGRGELSCAVGPGVLSSGTRVRVLQVSPMALGVRGASRSWGPPRGGEPRPDDAAPRSPASHPAAARSATPGGHGLGPAPTPTSLPPCACSPGTGGVTTEEINRFSVCG